MSPIAKASSMVLKNPRVAGAFSGLWPKAAGMLKGPVNYMGQNPGRTQAAIGALANIGGGPGAMFKGGVEAGLYGSMIGNYGAGLRGPLLNRMAKAGVNPQVANAIYGLGVPLATTGVTQALAAQPGGAGGGGNFGGGGGYAGYAGYGGGGNFGGGVGTGALGGLAGGVARQVGGIGQGAVGLLGYNHVTGEPMYGVPLPAGTGTYGNIAPAGGNPLGVVSPGGVSGARRLEGMKSAELTRDMMNVILPTERKYSEQAKRDEFARQIAAAGIRENIATNAAMRRATQQGAINMGQSAAQGASNALAAQFQYT